MEVLPLDLYNNVQVGVTIGKIAGDYNLELAESQVSLAFHWHKRVKLAGCVRNGRLTFIEKLPLCTRWVKCPVKCGNYLKKNIIYLVLIVLSAPQSFVLMSFPVGNFPTPNKQSKYRLIQCATGTYKSYIRPLIIAIFRNVASSFFFYFEIKVMDTWAIPGL